MRKAAAHLRIAWPGWYHRWHRDVALALVVGAIQIIATNFASHYQPDRRALDAGAIALLAAGALSLVVRRQYPVAVLIFAKGTTLLYWGVLDYPGGPVFLAVIVAFFTAVMMGRRLVAWAVLAAGFLSFPWLPYLLGNRPAPSYVAILGLAAWLLVLGTVAEIARVRRERTRESALAREEQTRRRASDERLRIARELHDVLGHNISLISVQAGVALHLMDERPEQARVALSVIKEASKDALRELRSVLDVLRHIDEESPRSPAPGLAQLDELVSRAAAAGLEVSAEVEGDPRRLPASVELAAFRIVQEALTNVIRHAGATRATIRLVYDDRGLAVQVDDDGRGADSRDRIGAGQGILGMRERVSALGGVLEAGPRPGGGFRVLARLPLNDDSSTRPSPGMEVAPFQIDEPDRAGA
ncbi:MAG: sensor histidine kinase [Chloroflexi bacterium]|nr:sensor histidine kinase [Chloroflexota bacterium]